MVPFELPQYGKRHQMQQEKPPWPRSLSKSRLDQNDGSNRLVFLGGACAKEGWHNLMRRAQKDFGMPKKSFQNQPTRCVMGQDICHHHQQSSPGVAGWGGATDGIGGCAKQEGHGAFSKRERGGREGVVVWGERGQMTRRRLSTNQLAPARRLINRMTRSKGRVEKGGIGTKKAICLFKTFPHAS
jgi:hypothetical protein